MHQRALWIVVIAALASACALNSRPDPGPVKLAELWQEPADLEGRDLLNGPGGPQQLPASGSRFEFVSVKTTGTQPGYDAKDEQGRLWGVKLGVESRTEVVVSRLVWALGYHQPIVYYVPAWTLVRDGRDEPQPAARFRLESAPSQKIGA